MYKKYTWNDRWLLTPTTNKVVSPVQEVGGESSGRTF